MRCLARRDVVRRRSQFRDFNLLPDQFAEFIKSEAVKWSKVVKDANLRVE